MEVDLREAAAAEGLRQLEQACLPTSLEWHTWWTEWKRHMEMRYNWERALVDAVTRLQKNQITLARQLRNTGEGKTMIKYNSDGHVYGEETRWPDEITREALVWFIAVIKPAAKDAPTWAQQLFRAVEGCYIQQARLGLEQSAIRRKGYLTLNHAHSAPLPTEKEIADNGMAAFGKFSDSGTEVL